MKQQRFRFKVIALILFGLFVLLTAYSLYSINVHGNRWFAYNRNPRIREQKLNVTAGNIIDRNGVVLASTAADGRRVYQEDAAARKAVFQLLGVPTAQNGNGVETFQTGYLYGFHATLPELLKTRFSGSERVGDDLVLTIDSRLCTRIASAFSSRSLTRGKNGAAVVMNYKTGEVVAMVSLPGFDPMSADLPAKGAVFINRVTQMRYPPGSTFKIITAASALENLPGAAQRTFDCTGALDVSGQLIHDFGGTAHGSLTLQEAFAKSCNGTFAALALELTDARLQKTAANFGVGDNFLFRDIVVENSQYRNEGSGTSTAFETAMNGFGQAEILVTPMHMCLVAACVANDGVIMEPTLLRSTLSGTTGRVRDNFSSTEYRAAIAPETAAVLQEYMRAVVTGGTGRQAAVSGLTICGKTGSAEVANGEVTHGWFIGYCADEELPFAVAILVENIGDGQGGGSTAAPIAADIFTYLRDNRELVAQ